MKKSIPSSVNVFISIIIPTWNNDATLPKTLKRLTQQTFQNFEVLIVDNGSTNFNKSKIEQDWQPLNLKIIVLKENTGFTHACNLGVQHASGEWLAFLNADAFPQPDWLEQFYRSSQQFLDVASFCSLITQARHPDMLDGTGDVYNFSGNAWKRQAGYPIACAPQEPQRVFSANAAAAFYRRDVFLEIGGFDEDFFSYFEDVDLGFRLNLAGHQCFFLPSLRVEHIGSSSTGQDSDFAVYHHHRNSEWVFWKNMPGILFFIYFPLHLLGNIVFFLKYFKNGRAKIVIKAKFDALKYLGPMLSKRRMIQKQRRVSILDTNCMLNKQVLAPYLLGYSLRKFNKAHNGRETKRT